MSEKIWVDDKMYFVDEEVGEYVRKLEEENEKYLSRINKMCAGDLSPESRLTGYSVVSKKLQEEVKYLRIKNGKLKDILEKMLKIKELMPPRKGCFINVEHREEVNMLLKTLVEAKKILKEEK